VLLETIETLQAGSPGEQQQRLVSLTAQLVSASTKEGSLERRAQELLVSSGCSCCGCAAVLGMLTEYGRVTCAAGAGCW